jgi:hypothetical protein
MERLYSRSALSPFLIVVNFMLDTLRFRIEADLPLAYVLRERGFTFGKRTAFGSTWHQNVKVNDACILKLDWYDTYKRGFLSAEVSAPKLLFGNNVQMISGSDMPRVVESVSNLASHYAGVDFDAAQEADITRADISYNWKMKEVDVYARLHALRTAHYPRMLRGTLEGDEASIYFRNRGRKKTEEIVAYAKHPETYKLMRLGQATEEHLKASIGNLRTEHRLFDEKVMRVAKDLLKRTDRKASMLTPDFAEMVIKTDMKILGLDKEIRSGDERLLRLHEYCDGDKGKFVRLSGLLFLADTYGADNLVTLGLVAKSSFHDQRKELEAAGVWMCAPSKRTLAPLADPNFKGSQRLEGNTLNLVRQTGQTGLPTGLTSYEWVH